MHFESPNLQSAFEDYAFARDIDCAQYRELAFVCSDKFSYLRC